MGTYQAIAHEAVILKGTVPTFCLRLCELLESCFQPPAPHYKRNPLLPVGVLREATHKKYLRIASLQRNGADILRAILDPIGDVATGLSEAGAMKGKYAHYRLDR